MAAFLQIDVTLSNKSLRIFHFFSFFLPIFCLLQFISPSYNDLDNKYEKKGYPSFFNFLNIKEGATSYLCVRVVDGDTIVVNIHGKNEKVRLIGVDTPECVHSKKQVQYYAKEASDFTRGTVEGRNVTLKYDWQQRDRYGRILAYVYLEDGTFLNAEIIRQGYGFAYLKYPFKYADYFRRIENEARKNKRGLWN